MESENGQVAAGLGWFVFGAMVGASVAILLAPERGVNTNTCSRSAINPTA